MIRYIALVWLGVSLVAHSADACGTDTDCSIGDDRHYRVYLPDDRAPGAALVFAHGYRGSAKGTMRNKNLRRMADRLGVAFIAIKSGGADWVLPNAPSNDGRSKIDELAYLDAVLNDAGKRFGIRPEKTVMTGFSAGGMMTWTVACGRGDRLAGYIPVSGTFWAPMPSDCNAKPAPLIHIHGLSDKIVPLTGRPIGNTHQGDIPKALDMYATHGAFSQASPIALADELSCTARSNTRNQPLIFCTHPGGHSFKSAWIEAAWQKLKQP